jgi:hypothetical protein
MTAQVVRARIAPPHVNAMDELREPLAELGRRWAASPHRPRPSEDSLKRWDELLASWLSSDLPLILRDSRRRGERLVCASGRGIIFADNTPANWIFHLALEGVVPDITSWRSETLASHVPLTFLTKGANARRDLNKAGWKVCHIAAVSDRKRYKIESAPFETLEAEFMRFLSPRNIFLIPKTISGAGELLEVVSAIAEFERKHEENHALSARL